MTTSIAAIVEKQVNRWHAERDNLRNEYLSGQLPKPVITVSRLLGAGASDISEKLAQRLECELVGIKIMDEVSKRSDERKDLVDALDERARSQIGDWIEKVFKGKSIDSGQQYRYLLESMNYFMSVGSVVMLGRGASFAPKTRPRLDIRIVAPMDRRESRVMKLRNCSRDEAMLVINESDAHRAQFIKFLFGADWWDAREYDLIVNTANISTECAVTMVETAWLKYASEHSHFHVMGDAFA